MSFFSKLFGGNSLDKQLLEAASFWKREPVIALSDAGADIHVQNEQGQSVLCHALNI